MGVVYRAARVDGAFERDVALKVLPALGGDARRFRAERQILARLDHPHVARLYGGGVTGEGQLWLAMELVEGEPVTAYSDRERLGVDDRLRLFLQVCEAVHYAHGRLVVHRDLKPSNVLVAAGPDGRPHAKLLDFGVAKLLGDDAEATRPGAAPRTPAYAAPEQVAGGEVTTATDVWALGVLLYELLTGCRPFAGGRGAVERAVLDRDPPPPSAAVTAGAAAARASTADRLARRLRGNLDAVVLKALRREPERRYASAAALGADLGRSLDGLPVEARVPSRWDRARAFVRRHRVGAAAAAAAVLALAVGLGLALWQGRLAAQERDRAERAAAFMVDLLGEFDPNRMGTARLDGTDVLDRAVVQIEGGLADQPEVQARLYDNIGQIYQTYTRFDDADRLLHRALALRQSLPGADVQDAAASLNHIAWLHFARGDYAAADSCYARALALLEADGRGRTLTAASSIEGRGLIRRAWGRPEEGVPLVREALAAREATLPPGHPDVSTSVSALATLLYTAGRYDEAAPLFRRAIAERRRSLGRHVHTAQSLSDYGALLTARGTYAAAVRVHREALAIRRDLLGDAHPHVAQSLSHMGWALQAQGRVAEAEPLYREALTIRRAHYGDDHAAVGNSLLMLGEARVLRGDVEGGLALEAEAVETLRRVLGPGHPTTLSAALRHASALRDAGRTRAARAIAADLLPDLRAAFGPDHAKARRAEDLLAAVSRRTAAPGTSR
jgi:serine/threonine-protein kinase